jgi:glycosyltransferase involved in cell wall biosynthesis
LHHVVINKNNRGLARTFRTELNECLKLGADIIVNIDGDNQYAGWAILKLIQPILDGKADVVLGDRNTAKVAHFSPFKKFYKG